MVNQRGRRQSIASANLLLAGLPSAQPAQQATMVKIVYLISININGNRQWTLSFKSNGGDPILIIFKNTEAIKKHLYY